MKDYLTHNDLDEKFILPFTLENDENQDCVIDLKSLGVPLMPVSNMRGFDGEYSLMLPSKSWNDDLIHCNMKCQLPSKKLIKKGKMLK